MKFKLTRSAIEHGCIATGISIAVSLLSIWAGGGWSLTLSYMGAMFYLGRELCDLEKLYDWDVTRWNSAELIMPILFNTVIVGAMMVAA